MEALLGVTAIAVCIMLISVLPDVAEEIDLEEMDYEF